MAKAAPKRGKNKDNARRSKKKTSILTVERVDYVDYKDVNLLRRFMSDRAKIRARRVTGNNSQQQKEIAKAIKNAREMALLPYTNRVTTQRGGGGRGDRGPRDDRPPRGERDRDLPMPVTAVAEEAPAVDELDVVAAVDVVDVVDVVESVEVADPAVAGDGEES
jgi:small subunit ribosomal protein S18